MWSRITSKLLLGLTLFLSTLLGEDLIYTPKVFFDTTQPIRSLKGYDKPTAEFLRTISKLLEEKLVEHLLQKRVVLLLKTGIGSDITFFYTFPEAKIYKITLYREEGTRKYYRYGYRLDISLALYVFKTGANPQLLCYKVYRFRRYFPPTGEYLPIYLSLAEPIADSFYLNVVKDLDAVIEKVREKLNYYRQLGMDNATSPKGSQAQP